MKTYFPQDPRVDDFDEIELILLLSEIRNMLNNKEFDEIIWTGDINTDFMRGTRFVRIIDDFINEMNILYDLLTTTLKSYIIHCHVSEFLLMSTLIPIIKDKLGDITMRINYRSFASSSLVMKIYDLVITAIYNKYLQLDDLQYRYQPNVSTSMCTWMAVETISYFHRNGSDIFTCMMDMSKAFNTVRHSLLFKKLVEQGHLL